MISVHRHIGGSFVVVFFQKNPMGGDLYIDARKDFRNPECSHIEVVINGRVIYRETQQNTTAPERIMEMVRNVLNGRHAYAI